MGPEVRHGGARGTPFATPTRAPASSVAAASMLVALVLLAACDPAPRPQPAQTVEVFLRTDLLPGAEFDELRLFVRDTSDRRLFPLTTERFDPRRDWANAAQRIAIFPDTLLGANVGFLQLELVSPLDDARTIRSTVAYPAEGPRIDFVVTRSCQDVRCDGTQRCLGGRCVPRDCRRGDEPSCGAASCAFDDECRAGVPDCAATGRCDAGVCLFTLVPSDCGPGHFCQPGDGCRPIPGAGRGNGQSCRTNAQCASDRCEGGTCCNRACSRCESCATGVCAVRPLTASEPSAEVCDGLDNDCDGSIDRGALVVDESNCGACGFACASGERCVDGRCNVESPCETLVGLTCADIEVATLEPARSHESMLFGSTLAVAGDLVAIGAPGDGFPLAGVSPAPELARAPNVGADYGGVHLYRRESGGWALEAVLRQPDRPLRNERYGQRLAARPGQVAVSGFDRPYVDVFREERGLWTGPERLMTSGSVQALAFDAEGRLVILGPRQLEVVDPEGRRQRFGGFDDARTFHVEGRGVAIATGTGALFIGSTVDGVRFGGRVSAELTALIIDGPRLFTAQGRTASEPGIEAFEEDLAGPPRLLQSLRRPESGFSALARVGDYLAAGSPDDPLADGGPLGVDVRLRSEDLTPGDGTVFLYPLPAGVPVDAPLYLRAETVSAGAHFGASLASDGTHLFVGAPGDGPGSVFVRRLAP